MDRQTPRGPPLPKRAYNTNFKISADSAKDFKIVAKISDYSEGFKISRGFLQRFQDFRTHFSRFHGSQRTA